MTVENAKDQTFSNDATRKLLGYEYQKLFALECCLNSKPGDIIYIECYGDVATSDTSYEVKYHGAPHNLTDQSPDFWKTLKNFVIERNSLTLCSKLILHTTSHVRDDSIFFEWNSKKAEERLRLIKSAAKQPNDTIKKYTEIIFDFDETYSETDLIEILRRFEINSSQILIKEKCDELKNHPTFTFVDENLRDALLNQLYAYISRKAIEDSNRWHIIFNIFKKDIQGYIRSFQQSEIPFPKEPEGIEYTGHEKYRFINELRAVDLDSEVESAVIEYLMAEKNSLKLIETGGYFVQESLDLFESDLKNKMILQKRREAIDLELTDLSTPKAIKTSKKLFINCKLFDRMRIRGVQPIEMYYQYGKMHKIVDEQGFCWEFTGVDLS